MDNGDIESTIEQHYGSSFECNGTRYYVVHGAYRYSMTDGCIIFSRLVCVYGSKMGSTLSWLTKDFLETKTSSVRSALVASESVGQEKLRAAMNGDQASEFLPFLFQQNGDSRYPLKNWKTLELGSPANVHCALVLYQELHPSSRYRLGAEIQPADVRRTITDIKSERKGEQETKTKRYPRKLFVTQRDTWDADHFKDTGSTRLDGVAYQEVYDLVQGTNIHIVFADSGMLYNDYNAADAIFVAYFTKRTNHVVCLREVKRVVAGE